MDTNENKVVCVIKADNPDDDFSVLFPAYVYDFLQSKFGDVSFPLFFVFQPIGIMPLIAAHAES
ncbi:MAG: hypothetical protein Q8L56_04130 [Rhodocyclaceae bacterium]|nr:hypothetical protein [Rhodocyclaceae bacterium]